MAETWRNRIVGYSDEPPDQLLAHPSNWRTHPGSQAAALRGVLTEVGIVQNVICNRRNQTLIDGHLRVMEALKSGQPTIPVTWVDLSPAEEAVILATIDPLSAMAGTDAVQLDALLRDVSTGDAAVQAMLDSVAVKAGIAPGEPLDPTELWKGMPEFEQDALSDKYKSLIVHFETADDYEAFARLVNQSLTDKSNFIWYPYKPTHGIAGSMKGFRSEDES